MRVLFNCSVNVVGGAVQNAANFIKYAVKSDEHEFFFIVSEQVKSVLDSWGVNGRNICCVESPSVSRRAAAEILEIERQFSPDVVYTMAGPTYIRFKSLHVMGISDPYITHADFFAFRLNRRFFEACKFFIKEAVKGIYARFSAHYFIFQTETSRLGFCRRFLWARSKTFLVPNAIGEAFLLSSRSNREKGDGITVFVPSAYYPHKNLEIIIDICLQIKGSWNGPNVRFVTTAKKGSRFDQLIYENDLHDLVSNVGPYSYADALDLYLTADCVFIPSVLETFSTSYLEAIALCKPLVVADKEFAREVCGECAHYFDASSALNALAKIVLAVEEGFNYSERDYIVAKYGSQKERFNNIIRALELIVESK